MTTLLELPRELRDKILSFVISTPATPPANHSVTHDRTELYNVDYHSWETNSKIKYLPKLNRTDLIPTLLVNRQLHSETIAAIKILPSKHTYILDVMLVNLEELWPTWLSIPSLTYSVDRVHAIFRIDGTSGTGSRRSRFRCGDGSPPQISWAFYGLLGRFLKVGPVLNPSKKPTGGMFIKNLDLEVQTTDISADPAPSQQGYRLNPYVDADYLAGFLQTYIRILLEMSYHTASFGGIIYERVGTIRIMLDGQVRQEWDLATKLQELKFHDAFGEYPREERSEVFKKWKSKAHNVRKHLGLNVIPMEDQKNE